MDISRRGFLKVLGGTAAVLALPQFKTGETRASDHIDAEVYVSICGFLKTQTQYILKDTRIGVPFDIPVPFFLIRHGGSWVAFDTGNNVAVANKNPAEYWGEALVKAYTPVMQPHEEFKVQIKKLGIAPKDITCAIISHGHLDHAGAIDNFVGTKVPIYFQKVELEWVKQKIADGTAKKFAYIPDDFKHMNELNIVGIEGVLDVFGDQSVVAFPTPGHTPGHQSVLVRTERGNMILAQDACYTLENMMASIPPGLAWNVPMSLIPLYTFKIMNAMGAHIVPPHDPDFWKNKPVAPEAFRL